MFSLEGGPIAVLLALVIGGLLIAYISRRYQVAGPNQAFIIAGARGSKVRTSSGEIKETSDDGLKVVVGAGVVILPIVHKKSELSLESRQSTVELKDGVTKQGIKVKVNGNAVFKVGREPEQIRKAAERFIGQEDNIAPTVQQVLTGSLRSIVGQLTIEQLVTERQVLMAKVTEEAERELERLGIVLDVLNIQDIADDLPEFKQSSYIEQMGAKNYQLVRQQAEIAEADAEKAIIAARRDQALKAAEAKEQTDAAERKAAQSGPLAEALAAQEVTRTQTELAILEAERREKELLATTIKQATAEAEAQIERARGARLADIAAAEADAERVRIEGNAAAAAIFAKGRAEAEAMSLKAEAYRSYNEAAVLSIVMDRMPEMIREAAAPMSGIDTLTVLSADGASDVVKNATRTVAETGAVVKGLTGIDIAALVAGGLGAMRGRAEGGDVAGKARAMAANYEAEDRARGERAAREAETAEEAKIANEAKPAAKPAAKAKPVSAAEPAIEAQPVATAKPVSEPDAPLPPVFVEPKEAAAAPAVTAAADAAAPSAQVVIDALPARLRDGVRSVLARVPRALDGTRLDAVPLPDAARTRLDEALAALPGEPGTLTVGELRALFRA